MTRHEGGILKAGAGATSVVAAFSLVAERHAQRIALEQEPSTLTYAELDRRANHLARRLAAAGIRAGDVVATLTHRSIETIIGWLAILKCGAAYLPIDPHMPAPTRATMLAEAEARLVLRAAALPLEAGAIPVMVLEDALAHTGDGDAPAPRAAPGGEALAYIMYTSGSTGRPKGVLVPHRAILRLVLDADYVSLTPDTVMLHLAPLAFDACTFEIWGALLNGGRLVIVPDAVPSLETIAQALARHRVTTLWLTAGLFHLMVESRLEALKGLTQLIAGGDVLSATHVRRAMAALPNCDLINGYGPTENTTFTCCYRVPREGWGEGALPIGYPIRGTRIHILDEEMREVAPGEEGQLCAGGAGVGLGYCGRPDLTAERFIPDPFSVDPAARLYLTGDTVRQRPDGAIAFFGRRDRQIKIDGFRIELDEIEHALRAQPLLADAAVVLAVNEQGTKRIAAFVKPSAAGEPNALVASVTDNLRAILPPYSLPHLIRVVPAFPLNANGKIDRSALIAALDTAAPAGPAAAPATSTQAIITQAFQDILGERRIDPARNLFELGATSMLIMRAHERIAAALGRGFPITDMFAYPTIAALAAHLGASAASSPADKAGIPADDERVARQRAILARAANQRR